MKRNTILSALALALAAAAAALPAAADDITPEPPFTSTRSRAEVIAELEEFRRAGVNPWADHYDMLADFTSSTPRALVQADYLFAREEVAAMTGEDSGSAWMKVRETALAGPLPLPLPAQPVVDHPVIAGAPASE